MSDIQAAPTRIPWPPLIYLAAIALGVVLGVVYPLPWISKPISDLLFAAGWLAVAAFVAIIVAAMRALSAPTPPSCRTGRQITL